MGAYKLIIVFFSVMLANCCVSARKYHVPVLIWGRDYENNRDDSLPSLAKVSSDEFVNHFLKNVHKINEKPSVVLFVEETLSVEDFSVQDVKREGSFPMVKNLMNNYKREFLQSVENPVSALTSPELKAYGFYVTELNESSPGPSEDEVKKSPIYVVYLEDADSKEDRPQMLERHDKKISKIFEELSKNKKNIIGIVTGRFSSWTEPEEIIRVRRQANETAPNETVPTTKAPSPAKATNGVILETKTALIYSKTPPVLKINEKEITLENPTSVLHDDREKWQRAIFSYVTPIGKVNLRFRFENTSNYYWSLSQVELEDPQKGGELILLSTKQSISAPYEYSYHTSNPVIFSNKSNSLIFSDMQVQPWKSPSDNKKFGLAEDDTTFFTPPIWTGLIVTGLISIILMWGLSMIMDIRTMDQFDDPKGKTITVNVTD